MRSTGTPVRVCREPAPLILSRSEVEALPLNHPRRPELLAQIEAKETAVNAAHAARQPKP
ncbi:MULTISPECIES: hypothetical protein [unclassified Geothrix]|uniref:hypothetical protein n=1 Tax=unclassified Geothrix TaxID=2647902 RepID=UPI0025B977B5|nr:MULTISPECIES: hypothetical protein [unclassified Geothrix]WLT33017.1 hypothetical protein Q9293_06730 [Geothrix sp. PMB-07]